MRRRFRLLRVAKWGGVVACVLLALIIVLSYFWFVGFRSFRLDTGCVYYSPAVPADGWFAHRTYAELTITDPLPPFHHGVLGGANAVVPIWPALALLALLSGLAFWIDHRRPQPGNCPCGYDLTGNTSGVCPECSVEVQA